DVGWDLGHELRPLDRGDADVLPLQGPVEGGLDLPLELVADALRPGEAGAEVGQDEVPHPLLVDLPPDVAPLGPRRLLGGRGGLLTDRLGAGRGGLLLGGGGRRPPRRRRLRRFGLRRFGLDGAEALGELHEAFPLARCRFRPKSLKRPWFLTGCSMPSLARARSASGRYSRRQAASLRETSAVGSEASTGMPMLIDRETSRA